MSSHAGLYHTFPRQRKSEREGDIIERDLRESNKRENLREIKEKLSSNYGEITEELKRNYREIMEKL